MRAPPTAGSQPLPHSRIDSVSGRMLGFYYLTPVNAGETLEVALRRRLRWMSI